MRIQWPLFVAMAFAQNCKHYSAGWRSILAQSYLFVTTA